MSAQLLRITKDKKTMDSFLSTTTKTVLFAVAFVFMISPTLGFSPGKKTCDLKNNYQLYNGTVKNLGCYPCPDCGPGWELPIPCGKSVPDSESISEHSCIRCKPGTYSTKNDKLPCKTCHRSMCAQHEIVHCNTGTGGNSRCTGICEKRYVWNKKKTECKLYVEPQVGTTKKPSDPQMQNNTTKNPDEERTHNTTVDLVLQETNREDDDESGMPIHIGSLIAIIIVLVLVILVIVICRYLRKTRRERIPMQSVGLNSKCVSEDDSSVSGRTSSEHLMKDGMQGVTIEVCHEIYNPVTNDSLLQTSETNDVDLLNSSDPFNKRANVAGSEQNTSIQDDQSSQDDPMLDLHCEEQSQLEMTNTSRPVTRSLLNPVQCTTSSQDNLHSQEQNCQGSLALNAHHVSPKPNGSSKRKQKIIQVRDVDPIVYKEICKVFTIDPLQDWKFLAGKMGYSQRQVEDFELASNKFGADGLITNWSNKEVENDIYKFIEILEKMEMATLVALINEELCKPKYRKNML